MLLPYILLVLYWPVPSNWRRRGSDGPCGGQDGGPVAVGKARTHDALTSAHRAVDQGTAPALRRAGPAERRGRAEPRVPSADISHKPLGPARSRLHHLSVVLLIQRFEELVHVLSLELTCSAAGTAVWRVCLQLTPAHYVYRVYVYYG